MEVKEITININRNRINNNGKILSRKEMEQAIYGSGLPKHNSMFHQCLEFGVMTMYKPNAYAFGQKPIYFGKIQNAYNAFTKQMKNYRK